MNRITTANDIKQLGTILSIWAHPDDETFTAGGIMATAVDNGQKVICLTATKGEAGVQDDTRWPANKLGTIRSNELQKALKILGISQHHWLGYKDGQCKQAGFDQAIAKIEKYIKEYRPNSILTFGPDGITGHPDHQSVSFWVRGAVAGKDITVFHAVEEELNYIERMAEADKKLNIYFNIDKPPLYKETECDIAYKLSKDMLSKKIASLKAMPSQTEAMFQNFKVTDVEAMLGSECFVFAK